MATKRKFSAAQLAAQKTFAEMARAGKFTKGKKKPAAKKVARKRNPVKRSPVHGAPAKKVAVKRVVRKRNPSHVSMTRPSMYCVHRALASGDPGALLGKFPTLPAAKEYAQAYATAHKVAVGIVGKK